jgi:hypothetical protein
MPQMIKHGGVGLLLILWAAFFVRYPLNTPRRREACRINLPTHYGEWNAVSVGARWGQILDGEINQFKGQKGDFVHSFLPFEGLSSFRLPFDCPFRVSKELLSDFAVPQEARLWLGVPQDVLHGKVDLRSLFSRGIVGNCSNDDQHRAVFFKIGEQGTDKPISIDPREGSCPVPGQVGLQFLFYALSPSTGKSERQLFTCTLADKPLELLTSDCVAVPKDETPVDALPPSSSRSREYQMIAQCQNLALVVTVPRLAGPATVRGNRNFIVRPVKDDDRPAGFHLSDCVLPQSRRHDQPQQDKFHLLIVSGEASVGSYSHRHHSLEVVGEKRLLVSYDGNRWYDVVAPQALSR